MDKVNLFLDKKSETTRDIFDAPWEVSFVDHVQPKYIIPIEDYLTDQDIIQLTKLTKITYPTFPRMGNLLVPSTELPEVSFAVWPVFPDFSGKISYKGAPYGFDDVPLEEYKEYLLDIYGPKNVDYSNFGPKFLEDYKTIEDLVNVDEVLSSSIGLQAVNRVDDEFSDSRSLYRRHVLLSLFWKGLSNIKI